jgi:hypothetical protein
MSEYCNKGNFDQAAHFVCDECGPHAKVDEDGCCAWCGSDTDAAPCKRDPADYRALALELRDALRRAIDEDLLQCRCGARGFSDHPQGAWCTEVHDALAKAARVLDGDAAKETK